MKSKIPFSGMRPKSTAKAQLLSPCWDRKKNKFLERGKLDDIAHGSIIQVSTVYKYCCRWLVSTLGLGITPSPNNCIRIFKSAMSIMSGNGSFKLRNLENGVDRVGRSRMITRFSFPLEIRAGKAFIKLQGLFSRGGRKRAAMTARW